MGRSRRNRNGSYKKRVKHMRIKKWYIQDGRCFYCNRYVFIEDSTLDHILPVALGGTTNRYNSVMSCWSCNHIKADNRPKLSHIYINALLTMHYEEGFK